MAEHTTQSPPPPDSDTARNAAQNGAQNNSARFFGWMRSLGIVRYNGWIGGVCGGVAARFGIDPVIVRGIAVVIAVLGGPAFLLYAAAWLLLPDSQGDIHLERLIKGHFEPAMIGIIVLALFSFLPFAQGFWWAGAQFWGGLSWLASVGRVLWSLLIIGLIVAFVVWAARSGRVPPTPPRQGPPNGGPGFGGPGYGTRGSGGAPYPSTSPTDAGGGPANSASASAAPASTTHTDDSPQAPDTDSDTAGAASAADTLNQDEVADWRARQETWKADYAAWAAQQQDAKVVRQQRSAEMRAQAQALAAEADEARRRRRAANPRTKAAYVFIALGVALVAAGIAAAIALVGDASGYALPIALGTATGVVGLSIVVAGILRRRSGFLTFVSIVLVLATIGTALPPRGHDLMVLPRASYWNASNVSIYQPVGSTEFYYDSAGTRSADIVQGAGSVTVQLQNGTSAQIDVVQHSESSTVQAVRFDDADGEHRVSASAVGDGSTHTYWFGNSASKVHVRIDQNVGTVRIEYFPAPRDQ